MGVGCIGLRGRGLSEDDTDVRRLCGLHECRNLGFEVIIQDFGAREDLNQPDLGEETEGTGEVGGVMGSAELDATKDSHEDVRDMELEAEEAEEVEGVGEVGGETAEQARQGKDLRRCAFCLPFLFLRSSSDHLISTRRTSKS